MTFQLKYSEVLQGSFQPGALNLMMIFQVNCPGCFMHGFPQMLHLHEQYKGKISCFALSTVFEDFELNTSDNTNLLLRQNLLVGETRKAFDTSNLTWDKTIPFPVLFDTVMAREEMLLSSFIDSAISVHPHLNTAIDQQKIKDSLYNYFNHYQMCGSTFAINLLQGTPTFVLFNESMDILLQWFGHVDTKVIEEKLNELLPPKQE
jgi:hypothetical protein